MFEVSPWGALLFTKYTVCIVFSWPPWPDSSKLVRWLFNVLSWIFVLFPLLLAVALVNVSLDQTDDYLAFTKTICLAISCAQAVIKMLVCKGQRSRLETLQYGIRLFLESATDREMKVVQRYVNRCTPLHFMVNASGLVASMAMILGPLVLPIDLPTDAKYPFPVDRNPGWLVAYLHQAIAGLQCTAMSSIDCQAAFLIWYAGARLELLAEEFQNATTLKEFNECIRKHQALLEHTAEVVRAVRFIIITTSIMTSLSIITGAVHLVSEEPLVVKSQFAIIDGVFACILFISAWPAENLINTSIRIGEGAFNCPWIQSSPAIRKNLLFVIQRSQAHCVISVAGILPEHSLRYYTAYLSKTFSFFTTLRVVIDKEG